MASITIPTRVMVMSNTHEHCFDRTKMPEVDIHIGTGDLTNIGEPKSLKNCVEMIGTIRAELKLVIAGNHDVTLDKIRRIENISDEEYLKDHEAARENMTATLAKEAGITYLEEGTHTLATALGLLSTPHHTHWDPAAGPFLTNTLKIDLTTRAKLHQTRPRLLQILSPLVPISS
jgi:predicted MPP superfamily phosphohydrolase